MPSFQDSAFIILLGLLLFGPKGLAGIARQVGKLMGEFRRASADFRMQMEDELRISEQAEQQKKIAAMEAAAPVAPLLHADMPEPEHPHNDVSSMDSLVDVGENRIHLAGDVPEAVAVETPTPLPIASSGDLDLMPPDTGLPVARSGGGSVSGAFDSIPHTADPEVEARHEQQEEHQEAASNG
ncbi:twin-arginine translocase TatA/TatE family subunit [Granulicella tundricola]|uniref:Sec-independent translocation protein mttA/Hcf106 n=1 Tax=Granulicella tundricola (strain ATCC BAA-1859 / DSM 23138 / MP5ACTX9) TaxID=1198114 RepID=E8X126_GRATM|nr:twin-arginine translocase TatA/TatE family subunit [Granulicella tundricola]ADW67892.1 sec-independent translocation protein mttA/Hcf106 [Granulicella tundricola MP5ACTX9]